MKLLSACCGAVLLGMPVVVVDAGAAFAKKMYYDYRPPGDHETQGKNCGESFLLPALMCVHSM